MRRHRRDKWLFENQVLPWIVSYIKHHNSVEIIYVLVARMAALCVRQCCVAHTPNRNIREKKEENWIPITRVRPMNKIESKRTRRSVLDTRNENRKKTVLLWHVTGNKLFHANAYFNIRFSSSLAVLFSSFALASNVSFGDSSSIEQTNNFFGAYEILADIGRAAVPHIVAASCAHVDFDIWYEVTRLQI